MSQLMPWSQTTAPRPVQASRHNHQKHLSTKPCPSPSTLLLPRKIASCGVGRSRIWIQWWIDPRYVQHFFTGTTTFLCCSLWPDSQYSTLPTIMISRTCEVPWQGRWQAPLQPKLWTWRWAEHLISPLGPHGWVTGHEMMEPLSNWSGSKQYQRIDNRSIAQQPKVHPTTKSRQLPFCLKNYSCLLVFVSFYSYYAQVFVYQKVDHSNTKFLADLISIIIHIVWLMKPPRISSNCKWKCYPFLTKY